MSTQYYAPQQSAPPAQRPAKFVPRIGERHVIALVSVPGRAAPPSRFSKCAETAFDLVDGRDWYVPQVVAHKMYAMGIAAGAQFEVTKIGGENTDLQIVPLQPRLAASAPFAQTPAAPARETNNSDNRTPPPAQASPASLRFMAAYKDAVDVLLESKTYAQSRGLALEIRCEDVRCLAATIMIDAKGGR